MRKILFLFFLFSLLTVPSQKTHATCDPSFVNPLTEVAWSCSWPIRFASVTISPTMPERETLIQDPLCSCKDGAHERLGITVGYREPSRLFDVVKDPYCLNGLGINMGEKNRSWGAGSVSDDEESKYFAHVHYYYYPVWGILELFLDFNCMEKVQFDIAYLTELDPMWGDDILSNLLNPESLLFNNPIAQMACAADAVSAAGSYPIDSLFWCNGSWGSVYPLGGTTSNSNSAYVESSANVASKALFKFHRELITWGTKGPAAMCGPVVQPVWKKGQYRFQPVRPVQTNQCTPLGRSSLLWGSGNNPPAPGKTDNFTYLLWRYNDCCAF